MTCLSVLTRIFKKKYLLLLRRKNFFSMTQQAGQDKLAANESDIAALTLQDVLCLVILTGCKVARLHVCARRFRNWKLL